MLKKTVLTFFLVCFLFTGGVHASPSFLYKPLIEKSVTLTYHSTDEENYSEHEYRENRYYQGIPVLMIKQDELRYSSELYVKQENMEPLYFFQKGKFNETDKEELTIVFSGTSILMTSVQKGKETKKEFKKEANEIIFPVDEFPLLIRNIDFKNQSPVPFKGLNYEWPYINEMVFQVEGKEQIEVKAGIFDTYKVKLTLPGWKAVFFKSYFWVSTEYPHYLIKYSGRGHEKNSIVTELVKIEY
jgi:hypothetical protein